MLCAIGCLPADLGKPCLPADGRIIVLNCSEGAISFKELECEYGDADDEQARHAQMPNSQGDALK